MDLFQVIWTKRLLDNDTKIQTTSMKSKYFLQKIQCFCTTNLTDTEWIIFFQNAEDFGGPRKEFFLMMMRAIKEKYFDKGLLTAFREDYEKIGILFGKILKKLTVVQAGTLTLFSCLRNSQDFYPAAKDLRIISYLVLCGF